MDAPPGAAPAIVADLVGPVRSEFHVRKLNNLIIGLLIMVKSYNLVQGAGAVIRLLPHFLIVIFLVDNHFKFIIIPHPFCRLQ